MKDDDFGIQDEPPRKDLLANLRGSKYRYIFIVLAANSLFLPIVFLETCLALIALPLAIIFFLWLLRVENFWHMFIVGVVALCFAALISGGAYIVPFVDQSDAEVYSIPEKLTDGGVYPIRGDESTLFNYTITVITTDENASIDVFVVIAESTSVFKSYETRNETMTNTVLNLNSSGNLTSITYYFETNVVGIVNEYQFFANIDGNWYKAGRVLDGQVLSSIGPISTNTFQLYIYFTMIWLFLIFSNGFPGFLILLLFLRFSRRSKEAKEKMMKRYEAARLGKEDAGAPALPRDKSKKIPTIPMGDESEEIFVCSECGSDVPASAKFCPNCGEPFEEDEE